MTIDVVTQRCVRSEDSRISREHSSNNKMLRHDRIDAHLFMDAFFVTRKHENSTRGNMCCQLFVTDKSFVHAEPLRKRSDLICALKIFAKEVGVP